MTVIEKQKVNFDPGLHKFSLRFLEGIPELLDEIAGMKQPYQKKFQFQKFEMQVVPMAKNSAYVYLGCILWGCYLLYKYKDNPAEVTGNVMKDIEVPAEGDFNLAADVDYMLESIEKLDKASNYYLKRPLRLDKKFVEYLEAYREFVVINGGFRELNTTDEIKIPEKFSYFANYTAEEIDELGKSINSIIDSGKIEGLAALAK